MRISCTCPSERSTPALAVPIAKSWFWLLSPVPPVWIEIDHEGDARFDPMRLRVAALDAAGNQQATEEILLDVLPDLTPPAAKVKVSYFPNWEASGADGPWRVGPNLMVVVPTSERVELSYGWTAVDLGAILLSVVGLGAVAVLALADRRRIRIPWFDSPAPAGPAEEPSSPWAATGFGDRWGDDELEGARWDDAPAGEGRSRPDSGDLSDGALVGNGGSWATGGLGGSFTDEGFDAKKVGNSLGFLFSEVERTESVAGGGQGSDGVVIGGGGVAED